MVPKEGKSSNSRQNHEVVPIPEQSGTGTTIQNPFGSGTKTSGTGITMQNVFGTDTKHSGTGTTMPKCQDFGNFHIVKPPSYTISMGTLIND